MLILKPYSINTNSREKNAYFPVFVDMSAETKYSYEDSGLLDHESDNDDVFQRPVRERRFLGMSWTAVRVHIAFTILYLIIAALLLVKLSPHSTQWPAAKISRELVAWETQFLDVDIGHNSIYGGPPSYDIDVAWHNLFEHANLRITADELKQMNKTSVALADGNGYMANLDVHHQLHCLKFLRWYIYPEYYDFRLNATSTIHADHCIENLRRNIMCLPSLELMMFDWKPDKVHPQPHFSYQHTCINWDKINAWTSERSFDYFDESLLINPILDPKLVQEGGGEEEE